MKKLFSLLVCLMCLVSGSAATLIWNKNAETNMLKYNIYFNLNGILSTNSVNHPTTNYVLPELPVGTNIFSVTAVDTYFLESSPSSVTNITEPPPSKPIFTSVPSNPTLVVGASLNLKPIIGGTLPISYQWYKDGNPISGATQSNYNVLTVELTHAGSYSLRASNVYGVTFSSNILVAILPAPLPSINVTNVSIGSRQGQLWMKVSVYFRTIDLGRYGATNYIITATPPVGSPFVLASTVSPGVFPSLPIDDYVFSAKTKNINGDSPAGSSVSIYSKPPSKVSGLQLIK